MQTFELEYYGGNGYLGVPEKGIFRVATGLSLANRMFTELSAARKYYDKLNIEKALWNLTRMPELLECHTVKQESNKHHTKNDLPF